ncbi:hypothetical protein IGI04_034416 [Brassica rapa subsp. trilocularis]|uniref:Uncharacterized protein n=1 Tax=Brassica rapa subsp. trilocularis TaxID=1813537 RepID=A0ABQ7LAX8_BRACM|nr:hypothetical protein IGI04_034416 [Brassica rapa subsp. trilocularis]
MFGSIVIQKGRHIHPGRASQSDLSERPTEVAPSQSDQSRATTSSHSQPERPARATSSSHLRFDASRHKKTRREGLLVICFDVFTLSKPKLSTFVSHWRQDNLFWGEKNYSILDHPRSNPYAHEFSFHLVKKVEGLEGQEELCFINNNGSWYKKEPNFQYNNYQQKSYPNNQQSGYPPRNNQQGSYQPQKNPSSGSSAPQESSTDTLLKQILESQTRSEKQVGYELKNLHSKIDGSYNELNNKFSHLASTRHIHPGRASQSDLSERPTEVAPSQSDQSRATTSSHSQPERPARATSSSHLRFDASRHKKTRREGLLVICFDVFTLSKPKLSTFVSHWRQDNLFWGEKNYSILDHPRSNPYAQEFSFPLVKKCFDIPQNWFDNLLYYNICLRSLENS